MKVRDSPGPLAAKSTKGYLRHDAMLKMLDIAAGRWDKLQARQPHRDRIQTHEEKIALIVVGHAQHAPSSLDTIKDT